MPTLSKQQVSNWVLLDYTAQKQLLQDKINFLEKKHKTDFNSFEKNINQATTDNFEIWDDYIDWKAYNQLLIKLLTKIIKYSSIIN